MKKRAKAKAAKNELPELVTVMMKVAERLEILEKKVDLATQVISRLSQTSSFMSSRAEAQPPRPQQTQGPAREHESGRKERVMYQAVCADCNKNCEVPFKPGAGRPVYCKACFVIRKAGHVPQDPDKRSQGPLHPRPVTTIPREAAAFSGSGKTAGKKKSKTKKPVKKKKK